MNRLHLSPPQFNGYERRLLLEAFDANAIGPAASGVDAFEREFAQSIGVPYAAAVASGTAALHLGLQLLDVGRHDEVITSTLAPPATANAISYCGAQPVFIDSDARTWTMDPGLLREELASSAARGRRPRAVLVVDLYGQCADYDAIVPVCEEFGVPLIEDAADALGSTCRGQPAGSFGSVSAFSFNSNKIITTSGGGMLVSHRSDWIERARLLARQARDHAPQREQTEVGYNYGMSSLLAAVGRGQLKGLPDRIRQRRANAAFYEQSFAAVDGIAVMPEASSGRSNRWLTCITIDAASFGATREQVRQHLESRRIETRPVWNPLHLQPAFTACRARGGAVAADLFAKGLCLPSGSNLSPGERERVVAAVLETPQALSRRSAARRAAPAPKASLKPPEPAEAAPARFVPFKRQVLRFGRAFSVALQLALVALANVSAFALRFDGDAPAWALQAMWSMLPWLVAIRGLIFLPYRLYQGLWQYSSLYDLRGIIASVALSTVVFFLLVRSPFGVTGYPRSIFIIDAVLLLVALGGLRFARRFYDELTRPAGTRRVLVIGAGSAGEMVVRDMRQNRRHGLLPVGFIDDDPEKRGQHIHGVPVLGTRQDIPRIMDEQPVSDVVIALPSANGDAIRSILRDFEPFRVAIKTLPTLRDLNRERVGVSQLRALRMEDLLHRAPLDLDTKPVRGFIRGRRVMITGAGGAAGSELSRQIAALDPEAIILFDQSDRALETIVDDLARGGRRPIAVLGDVANAKQVRDAMDRHRPHVVFHAAAQNGVRLIEDNPAEAIRTNVIGTKVVAEACRECHVGRMVLLSTTGAVHPTSVMGATRRIAELIVEAMDDRPGPVMCGVRLSSVLGRPGTEVPVFMDQVRNGGPVQVAHPDVRRHFILSAEAVQLLLYAAVTAERATTYVLDMGEQIKVVDLAHDVIRLEGFIPEDEIAIQFTGPRPGERLYEELAGASEIVTPSNIRQILRVKSTARADRASVMATVDRLAAASERGDRSELVHLLALAVPDFVPLPAPAATRATTVR